FVVGWYFSSKIIKLYDEFRTEEFIGEMLVLLENILVQIIIAGQLYFLLNEHEYARTFLAWYISLFTGIIIIKSYVSKKILNYYRAKGGNSRSLVLIGKNHITDKIIDQILARPHFGFRILGVVSTKETKDDRVKYLGNLEQFFGNLENMRIDDLIITSDKLTHEMLRQILVYADAKAIRTRVIPNFDSLYQNRFELQTFGGYPLISIRREPLQEMQWRLIKRIFDFTFSVLIFIGVFSWLFPIIALLIKLDSKGPVLFIQDRWGINGKRFRFYKFRSMRAESKDVTESGEFNQARQNDPRITKLGAFLRRTSLDELPQFINVFLGNMSVVGPRPHAHEHNLRTHKVIDKYMIRHWVKPGITGWAQINGFRGETNTNQLMQKRVDLDIWYIENWSFWLDIKIILMTVYNLLKGEANAY
ncbi:MAG: undecaprenyl-phosphate glucose phosphotransferase, partial [Cytophagaceae bacterium BCCC1]